MMYATRSEGFRSGGVNRRGSFPPYKPDFLTNYEIGWKTSFMGDRLRFNGAVYHGDWDNFQFSFLGANGLTNVTNAPGGATLDGIETDLQWAATDNFSLYGGVAYVKAELADDFCIDITAAPGACGAADFAPKGTRLPITAKLKGNLTGRFQFPMGGLQGYAQASLAYNGDSRPALLPSESDLLGTQSSYSIADFSFGVKKDEWELELSVRNAFDERASLYRYAECATNYCARVPDADSPVPGIVYSVVNQPRTIGVKFSQKF
jgi:outer membrane receptor protein involved in Fe transport